MKRTIKKAIALAVTTVMALSISIPTLPSTYASTTEENMVIESTTEISTEEAITTEVVTSEATTEEISTEVTTETTTEATEEKVDEGSTEVTTESLPIPSEEMLYELLFDEEWVSELTEDEIKEMYGFDSREEFEQYVEMVMGSTEELNEETIELSSDTDAKDEDGVLNALYSTFDNMNRAGELYVEDRLTGIAGQQQGTLYRISNGKLGYCIEHSNGPASIGTSLTEYSGSSYYGNTSKYTNILKALYYMYDKHSQVVADGGGFISTNLSELSDDTRHDHAVCAFACSYYNGVSTELYNNVSDVKKYVDYLDNHSAPLSIFEDDSASISPTTQTTSEIVTIENKKYIKSQPITLSGSSKLVYNFDVQPDMIVEVYDSDGDYVAPFYYGEKARFRGGESFVVYVPLSKANSTFSVSEMKCEQSLFDFWVYVPENNSQSVACIGEGTKKSLSFEINWEGTTEVKLKKVSSNADLTNGNTNYSLAGCIYNLYEGNNTTGIPYAVFTTNADGTSNAEEVYVGTFTAVEIQAPPGFKLNPNPIPITITSADIGTTKEFTVTDEPILGSVQVLKVLDNEELDGNDCYDKAATYVIRNAQGTQVGTLNTDAVTGLSNIITGLPLGNYTVVETVASKGCELDTTVHNVTLTSTNASESVPVQVKSIEPTKNDPVVIEIYKIDKDGNKVSGGASLAGAEFTITYYDTIFHAEAEIPAQYERQWVLSTKYDNTSDTYRAYLTEEYLISGSDLYIDEISGLPYLPLGTITIKETKTPDGYKEEGIFKDENGNEIPNGLYITQIETGNDDIPAVVGGHEFKVSNTVMRGDLAFTKIDHVTLEPMGGIPFKITSATTRESHIYITDDRGVLSTSSSHIKHSKDTNANDGAVKDKNGYYSNLTYCGAWFSGTKDGNINELEDGVGALPFDTYIIEELPCAANKDKTLIETQEIVISEDGVEVNDGIYTNVPLPSISTVEKDAETGTHISVADDKVILTDTIHYEYFEAGAKYTAFGVIVDKETEKPLKDAAGNYIISSKAFDVDRNWRVNKFEKKGDVDVAFTFDATGFDGKSFVVFEYVFEGDVTNTHEIIDANGNINDTGCFAKHAEINSVDQTGMFPSMVTKAWTVESENNTLAMDENVNVVDTVTMENLIVGEDYVLTATIINKATGETLKNEEGKEITGTLEFTATKTNDNKEVKFPTLKRKLFENEGSDFVIFEELTWKKSTGDVYYSKHTDINDTDQTLSLVTIGTTATYKGDKVAPATDNITITDVVEYKNLTIGKEYTIDGVIHVKSTGKPLLHADGTEVTATKTFTAKAKNGKESLDFTFDATLLQGESVVAFEYLKDKDIEVATHTELDDEDQTVEFPKISTTLVESETGLPMVYINKPVKLVDTVEYKDFIPGREYRMVGVLKNKSTGLPLWDSSKNTIITAEIAFTPKEKDGTVNVVFYFDINNVNLKNEDGTLADIVCFENCYFTDEETSEEIRFAHHEDIESVSQTIRVPSGRTSAKDGTNGTHTGTPKGEATIVDTVYYNNLIPGKSYRIEGKLWTKDKDGNAIPFLDGGKEVVSSVEFTPAEAVGSIEMVFKFNASSLKSSGTTITVFEDCYYEDTDLLVFTHSEIDDKDQQINYPSIITEIKDKNGNKSLEPEHKYTLIDTITYENLTVGETYVIEGVLMEKVETRDEHGTVLSVSEKEYVSPDGNKSTAVVEFTPTEPNGKVDVSFEFYTSEDTYNKTFVCFERIYTKATHTEICEHTDINDSKQSFTVTDQVKTGDGPLGIIIALMCFALAGIIFMISHKGKNKSIPLIKM